MHGDMREFHLLGGTQLTTILNCCITRKEIMKLHIKEEDSVGPQNKVGWCNKPDLFKSPDDLEPVY